MGLLLALKREGWIAALEKIVPQGAYLIHWLIDPIAAPDTGKVIVAQLRQNALNGKALKLRVKDKAGKVSIRDLPGENIEDAQV